MIITLQYYLRIIYTSLIILPIIAFSWKQSFATNIFIEPVSIPKNAMIIDIRTTQITRIPGALSISMHELKNKSFLILKNKPLIIIHEGYGCKHLIKAIDRLSNVGFQSVHLLKGGINAWVHSGRRIEGDVFEKKQLNFISPHFVFEDKDNIQVIEICKKNSSDLNAFLPHIKNLSMDSKTFIQDIISILHQAQNKWYSVIASDHTDWYDMINKKLPDSCKQSVFFLNNGTRSYVDFIKKQHMTWNHKGKVKINGPCRKCNQ